MKVYCIFALLLLSTGLAAASDAAVSPIEKVIELLEDLKTSCEEEAKEEAKTYDEFACFCKEKTEGKSTSITEGQSTIDEASATIGEQTALKVEKEKELEELKKTIETLTIEIADAEAQRSKEKAEYDRVIADLEKAISSLEGAISTLESSKPADLIQIRRMIRKSVALADVLDLSPKHRRAINALLQTGDADVPEGDYEFHSQGIIDVLNELLKDFTANKEEKVAEEEKAVAAHEALMEKKRAALKTAEEGKTAAEEAIDKAKEAIAEATDTLIEAEAELKDNQLYLKDLTERCETKAKEWDQRSQMRADELTALTKALEIIKGTTDIEAARAMFLQGNGANSAEEKAAPAAAISVRHTSAVDVMEDDVGDLSLSFLQKGTPRSRVAKLLQQSYSQAAALDAKRVKAIAVLAQEGKRLGSTMLLSLAMKLSPDPFKKVKTLIQGLIERLLKEMADEAGHKGFCDTELGKAKTTRDFQLEKTQKLSAELEKLEVNKEKLEEEITTLTAELKDLGSSLEKSTDMRAKEKEDNAMSLKDAKEGLEAIKKAIGVLKDFYKGAGKAKVLLEVSPIDEDGAAGTQGAYKGNQDAGAGIIGMLEVIQSDFERAVKTTDAAEKESQRVFVLFDRGSKTSTSSKETQKEQAEADLKSTITKIAEAMNDLADAQKLLDDNLKAIEELKPACIDTGMSYKERVAAREKEIEALKKALCILDTDGVEEDCQ